MTDREHRELLELAAKAVGLTLNQYSDEYFLRAYNGRLNPRWDPIEDDGDAFRLAVKLKLEIEFGSNLVNVGSSHHRGEWHMARESDVDLYAATRRAIVRAAAEIGRRQV